MLPKTWFSYPLKVSFSWCFLGDGHDAESSFWLPETQIRGKVSITRGIVNNNVESLNKPDWKDPICVVFIPCVLQNLHHSCHCRSFFSQEVSPQQTAHHGEIQHPLQLRWARCRRRESVGWLELGESPVSSLQRRSRARSRGYSSWLNPCSWWSWTPTPSITPHSWPKPPWRPSSSTLRFPRQR